MDAQAVGSEQLRAARARARSPRRSCECRAPRACARSSDPRLRGASPAAVKERGLGAGAIAARPRRPPRPRAATSLLRPIPTRSGRPSSSRTRAARSPRSAPHLRRTRSRRRTRPRGPRARASPSRRERQQAARGVAVARHVAHRARGHSSSASSTGISPARSRRRIRRRRLHEPRAVAPRSPGGRPARRCRALDTGVEARHLGIR